MKLLIREVLSGFHPDRSWIYTRPNSKQSPANRRLTLTIQPLIVKNPFKATMKCDVQRPSLRPPCSWTGQRRIPRKNRENVGPCTSAKQFRWKDHIGGKRFEDPLLWSEFKTSDNQNQAWLVIELINLFQAEISLQFNLW